MNNINNMNILCGCGELTRLQTSWTQNNPARRFSLVVALALVAFVVAALVVIVALVLGALVLVALALLLGIQQVVSGLMQSQTE
ncbi:hypothetical protein Tco_0001043 [Tanacetum coccineum]